MVGIAECQLRFRYCRIVMILTVTKCCQRKGIIVQHGKRGNDRPPLSRRHSRRCLSFHNRSRFPPPSCQRWPFGAIIRDRGAHAALGM